LVNYKLYKSQRVGIFVDVQNFYYSAKSAYNCKVNFAQILSDAIKGRVLVRAISYVIKADVGAERTFFDALDLMGYEVRAKDIQIFYGGAKKGDWDVGITMDCIGLAPKLDVVVLCSGDGDFLPLVDYLQKSGCRVEVMSFGKSTSRSLREAADAFFDLGSSKYLIPYAKDKQPRDRSSDGSKPSYVKDTRDVKKVAINVKPKEVKKEVPKSKPAAPPAMSGATKLVGRKKVGTRSTKTKTN